MSSRSTFLSAFLAVPLLLAGGPSFSPPAAEAAGVPGVRVDVLVDGKLAREYYANERIYVEARRGKTYSIRLSNDGSERVAVALAVDGLNTIDGTHSSAERAAKWVLGPYEVVDVTGWQVSTDKARRFVFTSEERSYGAWMGDTRNLGVISAAVFAERSFCCDEPRVSRHRHPGRLGSNRAGDDGDGRYEDEALADAEEAPSRRGKARQPASEPSATSADRSAGASSGASQRGYERREAKKERAATGSGRKVRNEVVWTEFDLDPDPVGTVAVRYGFHDELVELGVLPAPRPRRDLKRREQASGFAPDPGGRCCR